MHTMALIDGDTVINMIYIDAASAELFRGLGIELTELDYLQIGDVRQNGAWFRRVCGELVPLP